MRALRELLLLILILLPVAIDQDEVEQEQDQDHEQDERKTGVYGARTRNLRRDRAAL